MIIQRILRRVGVSLVIMAMIIGHRLLIADGAPNSGKKRALPPKWDQRTLDKFLTDARGALEGERPNFGDGTKSKAPDGGKAGQTTPSAGSPNSNPTTPTGEFAWSKLISADSLTDEIKSYQTALKDEVKNPSQFKGDGFKKARRDFSFLAVAFAVIAEYDSDVRWKAQALAARDLFARAGVNCKVATDQSFNDSKARAEDLAALVRGETLQAPPNLEPKTQWAKVSNRPPLMNRLDLAQTTRLAVWTANPADFNKNADSIYREAQVVAMLAEVIQRDGFEFTDDTSYKGFAQEMQKHALEIAEAAKSKNFDQARKSAGDLAKACSNCHGSFRQ
jgi:hypothetical protein